MAQRLPYDATTEDEVLQYYKTRARQLWHEGYRWNGSLQRLPEGFRTEFELEGGRFASYYLLAPFRGQKVYRRWLEEETLPIVTLSDCQLEGILAHYKVPYVLAGWPVLESVEYKLIEAHYGDVTAQRSRVFLMNHIDEGLAVMAAVGATSLAMRAYCLHPLLQDDTALAANFVSVSTALEAVPDGAQTMALAMEYRNIANAYLAKVPMPEAGIRLSPLKDVNDMLIGDKVQNCKDFQKYHAKTHENSVRLAEYFGQWHKALGVADRYVSLRNTLPDF